MCGGIAVIADRQLMGARVGEFYHSATLFAYFLPQFLCYIAVYQWEILMHPEILLDTKSSLKLKENIKNFRVDIAPKALFILDKRISQLVLNYALYHAKYVGGLINTKGLIGDGNVLVPTKSNQTLCQVQFSATFRTSFHDYF